MRPRVFASWSTYPLPGLPFLLPLDPAVRNVLVAHARERAFSWWQWKAVDAGYLLVIAGGLLLGMLGGKGLERAGVPRVPAGLIGLMAGVVAVFAYQCGFVNPRMHRAFRAVIADCGWCGRCGYTLGGAPSDRCPECGEPAPPAMDWRPWDGLSGGRPRWGWTGPPQLAACLLFLYLLRPSRWHVGWYLALVLLTSAWGLSGEYLFRHRLGRERRRLNLCTRCGYPAAPGRCAKCGDAVKGAG